MLTPTHEGMGYNPSGYRPLRDWSLLIGRGGGGLQNGRGGELQNESGGGGGGGVTKRERWGGGGGVTKRERWGGGGGGYKTGGGRGASEVLSL